MTAARITPNLFGIASGIAGLAGVWSVAHHQGLVPGWPADLLFLLATAAWVVVAVAWGRTLRPGGRSPVDELRDPVFGPFVALLPIVGMLLGLALAAHAPTAGRVVFDIFAMATLLLGGWVMVGWARGDRKLEALHSDYLVPTVAGGLIAAGGFARTGQPGPAQAMLAVGLGCWLVIGTLVLVRLLRCPPLPATLVPTLAIEITPPVLAGNAYLAITGGRIDALACGLAGYAVLMAVVQVRLARVYRRLRFSPGCWAFAFSYAATAAFALRWIDMASVPGAPALALLVLAAITALVGALGARTLVALRRGTFLPVAPTPAGLGASPWPPPPPGRRPRASRRAAACGS